ncbi:MAG: alpha/beta hydrolase, partial [Polyangiaceae bacterium]|nr:alpha/beta hydrolase [Polyangiaceae bacterium]
MVPALETHPGHGLSLRVHRWRPPAGTATAHTTVLLHGFLDAGSTWDLVAAPLAAAGHDVLAPDLRGFGASERIAPSGYYHFPDYLADVDALLRHALPPDARPMLVGHSMGATVAALYAGASPERIGRLVLCEGVGPPAAGPRGTLDRTRQWLRELAAREPSASPPVRRPQGPSSLEDAARRLAAHHPGVPAEVCASRAALLTERGADGALGWTHDPLHRTTSPTAFHLESFRAFLGEIRCPVLFVGGGAEGWHPVDEDERLAAIGAPLRRVELAGAGHMMHWTA